MVPLIALYGKTRRRYQLIVLLLLLLGSITAIRVGVRETIEPQAPEVSLTFQLPNGDIEVIESRWPERYQPPSLSAPLGQTFVNWYLDEALTRRFEDNITPLQSRTLYPRFDTLQQEIRFIDTYNITYGRVIGPVGSTYQIPIPPEYYGLRFTGYDVELPDEIPYQLLLVRALYSPIVQMITLRVGDTEIEVEFDQNQTILTTLIEDQFAPPDGFEYVGLLITTDEDEVFVPAGQSSPIPDGAEITPVYEPSTYRIRFNSVGATIRDIVREFEELIGTLPTPERNNYSFDGWFEDVNLTTIFNRLRMPAMDLDLFAKWTFIPSTSPAVGPIVSPIIVNDPPPADPIEYLYEFVDRGSVIGSGMLFAGDVIPSPYPVVEPTSGIRFVGWSPDPSTMPASNIQFVAQYTDLYLLTIVYNDPDNTVEVIEVEVDEDIPLDDITTDTSSMYFLSAENDDLTFQTLPLMTSSSSIIPISSLTPAIEAFVDDPTLSGLLITSGTKMPAGDLTVYARWNFEVEVQIRDPFEPSIILASGMFRPGQQITIENFSNITNTSGYQELSLPPNYRAPRVLPTSGVQLTEPLKVFESFEFNLEIGSGVIDQQSGVVTIQRNRFEMIDLPLPELFGYEFEGYYTNSEFSGSGVENFRLDFATISELTFPVTYYAKWTQLALANYTITFYDSGLEVITSGSFQSGSSIGLTTPPLDSVNHYVATWKESGLNQFTVPSSMPFRDVDFVPYYEFSIPDARSLIEQAETNGEFSGLTIPSGSTDITVVSGIIHNILSASGTLPLNITFDVTLSGVRLSNDGNNTYIISLSGSFQGADSFSINTSFVYDDEFKVQNSVNETVELLEENPTFNIGINESDNAIMTGFIFKNSSSSTLTTCLNEVGKAIVAELTFAGITVTVTPTLPNPIKSPVRFTITISIGNPVTSTQTLERWVYWNIGNNTSFNC